MILLRELERRINPEKSRRFTARQFRENLERLTQIAEAGGMRDCAVAVSVVGTNGKGSTSYYLAQMLASAGSAGLYTSPHLHSVFERIRIDLKPAAEDECNAALEDLSKKEDLSGFSYFELLTILSGFLFSQRKLPVRVYEAGLGGRLDATRIFSAPYVILTAIDLDHTELLGNTPQEILSEKLGICGPLTKRVFCGHQARLRREEIVNASAFPVTFFDEDPARFESYLDYNRAFALFCAEQILSETHPGLQPANAGEDPPGRLEPRDAHGRRFFFDNAHNPAAFATALSSLAGLPGFPGNDRVQVFYAVLPDRSRPDCESSIDRAGLSRIGMNAEGFQAIDGGIPAADTAAILKNSRDWNIFLGSHRLYDSFLDLTGHRKNSES